MPRVLVVGACLFEVDLNQVYGSKGQVRWFRKAAREAGLSDEISLDDLHHFRLHSLVSNAYWGSALNSLL